MVQLTRGTQKRHKIPRVELSLDPNANPSADWKGMFRLPKPVKTSEHALWRVEKPSGVR